MHKKIIVCFNDYSTYVLMFINRLKIKWKKKKKIKT